MSHNSAAIAEIENKIAERQTVLTSLESEITGLEEKKRQKEAEIPGVKLDLDALSRTLSILKGIEHSKEEEQTETAPGEKETPTFVPGSHTDLARSVLLEHGTPLRMPDLILKAEAKKPGLKRLSFSANVYRLAAEGKIFKVSHKKVSLLEWGNIRTASLLPLT